jgi:HK97 family phage prohead protease
MTTLTDVDEVEVPAEVDAQPEKRAVTFEYEIRSSNSNGVTFDGYAAVFGIEAEVRDWRGRYNETVQPGAFRKTLTERKPLLLYEHGSHPLLRTMPIGTLHKATEDTRGVHVQGTVFDTFLTAPIVEGMRSGDIRGMSYNFEAVKETWSKDRSLRSIQELRLLMLGDDRASEISITAVPVQPASQISLRSIMALAQLAESDDEIRAAWDAAREGTSRPHPEPLPPEHSVPETTLALYARVLSRRRLVA